MLRVSLPSLALVSAETPWHEFKNIHGKVYKGAHEDSTREQVFNANVQKIAAHNANNETWTMAVNLFADLTRDEFLEMVADKRPRDIDVDEMPTYDELDASDAGQAPSSIDWTQHGVVNTVQKQGQANSCWAHATCAVVESCYAIATSNLVKLSEQQLCDCSGQGTCQGGGDEQDAIPWYKSHGACGRDSYPYTGQDSSCQENSCDILVPEGTVTNLNLVPANVEGWKSALARNPITTGISPGELQFYSSGVISERNGPSGVVKAGCDNGGSEHAVVAVGYGTDGVDYFKIRNSYGPNWGEQGYVRVAQSSSSSKGTACIFQFKGSYPTINAGPSPSPSPSSCNDNPSDWKSSEGDSCSVYQSYNYCTPDGAEGSGWKHSNWGPITNYADRYGNSALDACCACGGGSRRVVV